MSAKKWMVSLKTKAQKSNLDTPKGIIRAKEPVEDVELGQDVDDVQPLHHQVEQCHVGTQSAAESEKRRLGKFNGYLCLFSPFSFFLYIF